MPARQPRSTRRLMRDLKDFHVSGHESFTLLGFEDDLSVVRVLFKGPEGSPYATGQFEVEFLIPADYPYAPPQVTLMTKVWHPNVSQIGTVCMNVISVDWKESTSLIDLTEAVQALLCMPNPDSPLNAEAATMMATSEELYQNNAILWTKVYGSGTQDVPVLEEGLAILMALGLTQDEAMIRGSNALWDMENAVEGL